MKYNTPQNAGLVKLKDSGRLPCTRGLQRGPFFVFALAIVFVGPIAGFTDVPVGALFDLGIPVGPLSDFGKTHRVSWAVQRRGVFVLGTSLGLPPPIGAGRFVFFYLLFEGYYRVPNRGMCQHDNSGGRDDSNLHPNLQLSGRTAVVARRLRPPDEV